VIEKRENYNIESTNQGHGNKNQICYSELNVCNVKAKINWISQVGRVSLVRKLEISHLEIIK
jgi:hypothetical protein